MVSLIFIKDKKLKIFKNDKFSLIVLLHKRKKVIKFRFYSDKIC